MRVEIVDADTIEINGQRFTTGFFRMFCDPDPNALYRFVKVEGGAVAIEMVWPGLDRYLRQ